MSLNVNLLIGYRLLALSCFVLSVIIFYLQIEIYVLLKLKPKVLVKNIFCPTNF